MISVDKLNDYLSGNFDAIMEVLKESGLSSIHPNYKKQEIRCSWEEGSNPSSVIVNVENLLYYCFSNGEKGNIFSLAMTKTGRSFPSTLKWIAGLLGLGEKSLQGENKKKKPFNGFFGRIARENENPTEVEIKKYDTSILNEYAGKCSYLFAKDGIGYDTQHFFQVGYDLETDRITIPQWTVNGELMGIMGRLNTTDKEVENRWLPIISCQRSSTLYGYHYNYAEISKKGYCLIGESEKFVMQLRAMGFHNALATCGCNISKSQEKYVKSLLCNRLILCYDEGLKEEQIREEAKKLQMTNPMLKNKVGYIYDANGEILKKGSKNSPSDLGKPALTELMRKKVIWL